MVLCVVKVSEKKDGLMMKRRGNEGSGRPQLFRADTPTRMCYSSTEAGSVMMHVVRIIDDKCNMADVQTDYRPVVQYCQ